MKRLTAGRRAMLARRVTVVAAAVVTTVVTALLAGVTTAVSPAYADSCTGSGSSLGSSVGIAVTCPGVTGVVSPPTGSWAQGQPTYLAYRWASVCSADPDGDPRLLLCAAALTCPDPLERRWQLWGELPDGRWVTVQAQCFGGAPPESVATAVTPTDVLSALRRVGLPRLETRMQPGDRTLANLDTIFWTDPVPVDLTLTILGQPVRVAAAPASYRWVYGDGAVAVTSSPGDPYPQRTVVHRYSDAHVTVHPHVEVTYSARFQVNGGPWQDVPGTVTTVGPETNLRVVEGAALLSGAHE